VRLDELFRKAVELLRAKGVLFAVSGGFAADLYRAEHRVTQDIDLSIMVGEHPEEVASEILRALGLHPAIARKADLEGGPLFAIRRRNTAPWMVVGRPAGERGAAGVDILLPAMGWVPEAVRRAQDNRVDFGFGPVPVITVEDVILAKFSAWKGSSTRFKDLDDLSSIFGTAPDLDFKYLAGEMRRLELTVPKPIERQAPITLVKASRDIAAELRRRRASPG
jgi:hypothetical protein